MKQKIRLRGINRQDRETPDAESGVSYIVSVINTYAPQILEGSVLLLFSSLYINFVGRPPP